MQVFLDNHAAELRGFDSGGARRELDDVTDRLVTFADAQGSEDYRTRGERHNEQVLANALRLKYFRILTRLSKLKRGPFESLRTIKFPFRRTNTAKLVTDAREAIAIARPLKDAIEKIAGRGWLADFAAATNALQESTTVKLGSRASRVGATGAIEALIKRAGASVAVVNALVVARLPEKSALLTEWQVHVRAFRGAGRKPKKRVAKG